MQHPTLFKIIAATSMPFLLAACGGGSGVSTGPNETGGTESVPSYTNLRSTTGPGTTKIKGIGREGQFTEVSYSSATDVEEYWGEFSPAADNSVEVTTDADGKITAVMVNTPSGSRSWDRSNAIEPDVDGDYAEAYKDMLKYIIAKGDRDGVLMVDPAAEGFEYQTFGMWESMTSGSSTGTTGLFSVGSETAMTDIPTLGTATFKGRAYAQWNDSEGNDQDMMTADTMLQADFAKRSVAFSTNNSAISLRGAYPSLDMNGTLSYGAGSNSLSGPVTTADGMTGTVDGRFYGPGAKEVGGVFSVSGNGYESLFGGFGAVRQ